MSRLSVLFKNAAVSGTIASITSSLSLAAVARAENWGAVQPLNATSHWLHGADAAKVETVDLTHTGVGYVTHHAATYFWATIFEAWIGRKRPVRPATLVRDAIAISIVAAGVDYIATPKRFTPGWELILSKRAMAVAYAAMAAGLALGVFVVDRSEAQIQN